ncbi:hypothetical protein GCM10011581_03140 [Saccharopolyspora subtropica]|uniref:Uncharacterized protein n=1 Tax=Saccharopolyspora thermophila TaxID=89367 RepID=A0A917JHR1_9PSEU|nr:SDR family oxidoreductase [Saccharopolyspora subtropica]GGI69509.1 hypothetical protein GCM10011581_03140 [Saccharopolyspora subtropica]
MGQLENKLALVTGGGKNVGAAIARELGRRGAHVIINYFHSPERARRTAEELRDLGVRVDLIRASVARQDQVDRMFAELEERFGYLDILVNNAANGALLPLAEITDEHLDKAVDTNYKGGLRCARAAAPLMARRGGGSIVTISALGSSQLVMNGYLACAPAKAAAEAVTRYLAVEFAPLNIRVNTASAAMLRGEVADAFPRAAEMQEVIRRSTPLGRLGEPEDLAAVVAFLASDDARWVTGQVVLADGGLSLGASLLSPPPQTESATTTPEDAASTAESRDRERGAASAAVAVVEAAPGPAVVTERRDEAPTDDIAIVGMGLAVAGANSPEEFWELRTTGAELFVRPPEDRWERDSFYSPDPAAEDKTYQDRFAFITGFQPDPGSALPGEPELTTAWLRHSLAQALRPVHLGADDRVSFLVGYTPDGSQHLEDAGVLASARQRVPRLLDDMGVPAHRRAELLSAVDAVLLDRYRRGARDPHLLLPDRVARQAMAGLLPADTEIQLVDTACSSSMYAIDIGVRSLLLGEHDVAVCGGAFALTPRAMVMFAKLRGLSRRGEVRAMDDSADGVLFADGAGIVVLKRLDRARRDGDRVLAVLGSVGTSSDGSGTAIYAPNPDGQDLAVRRALTGPVSGDDVDWVLAHATGTPAGDLAEFTTIRKHFHADRTQYLTSNKSLIGHTGWAAGVASVVEAVLALQRDTIPAQFRLTSPQRDFRIDETKLEIPAEPVPWPPRADRPRAVGVSGFGFGGTNAHLVVREASAGGAAPRRRRDDRVVIVGWSARLPGLSSRDQVTRWLTGAGDAPQDGFGDQYPAPPFEQVRLPPKTVRMMDRCQLMMVWCAQELRDEIPEFWQRNTESTGVFVGNMGPTRMGMLLGDRVYLDQVSTALRTDPRTAELPELPELVERLRADVRSRVEPSNEDSFPGMMPNIISARVASRFDLTGPNVTLDSGLSSALTAIETAARYLRTGDVRLALAAGVNGNSLPEFAALLGDSLGAGPAAGAGLAEGAFAFALTTERTAVEEGLPILAYVNGLSTVDDGGPAGREVVECGVAAPDVARYVGAAGGLGVLRALHGGAGEIGVRCTGPDGVADVELALTVPAAEPARLPARFRDAEQFAPGQRPLVRRHVPALRPAPAVEVGERTPFLPPGVVVLTDLTDLGGLPLPPDATVLCTAAGAPPDWIHLPQPTPETVREALRGDVRHVRIVTDLARTSPLTDPDNPPADSLIALHDAFFLAVQHTSPESVLVLLAGGIADGVPHPMTGLFTGLLKAVDLELPDCRTFALVTGTSELTDAARLAERESACRRPFPIVYAEGGTTSVPVLAEEPVEVIDAPARLGPDSVVLAVGGARGITAEIVKVLAAEFRPRVYLFGSNRLDDYPDEVFAGDDASFAAGRRDFIRRGVAEGKSVAQLNREYDRMRHARAARRTIAELERHCGPGRVTYLACDVADAEATTTAVRKVLAEVDRVDLLINAAGRNHSALIGDKDFASFTAIRDIKLRGYRNLKRAFGADQPEVWCNFGSLLGYFGQRGEADYAAGNDFLASAAVHAASRGRREFTIGWTFWDGVGMVGEGGGLANTHFKKVGSYSDMSVAEGVHHFVRELHADRVAPSTVHMGQAERRMVEGLYPGYLDACAEQAPRGRFYLRRLLAQTADSVTFETPFDLETDSYLRYHPVRGVPTLPGAFVAELAAEAALHLVPGGTVIGFDDTCFNNFLHVYLELPTPPKRIAARIADRSGGITVVDVRITTDVLSPTGIKLVTDRAHFTSRVLVADGYRPPRRWQPWPDPEVDVPAEESFRAEGAPILLSGPFLCVDDIRRSDGRARATYRFRQPPQDPLAAAFVAPPFLLDAMVRVGFLTDADGRDAPVSAPTRIDRVELYEDGNDWELMRRYGHLGLYAEVAGSGPDRVHHLIATAPDGHVVAWARGVHTAVVNW